MYFGEVENAKSPSHTRHRTRQSRGLRAGLFPVQSPLLRESLLVSFPPLIDMLKFSGLSLPRQGRLIIYKLVWHVPPYGKRTPSVLTERVYFRRRPTARTKKKGTAAARYSPILQHNLLYLPTLVRECLFQVPYIST